MIIYCHQLYNLVMSTCLISFLLLGLNNNSHAQSVNLSTDPSCNPDLGSVDLSLTPHGLVRTNGIPISLHTPVAGAMPIALDTVLENIKNLIESYFYIIISSSMYRAISTMKFQSLITFGRRVQ